jgi:cell division transport system permease protein
VGTSLGIQSAGYISVSVSPDGKFVYGVTGSTDGLVVFSRNDTTGHLTPVPALIHFDLTDPSVLPALERELADRVPGTIVNAHDQQVRPLLGTMRAVQWLALSLVVLMLIATSATVVLAARGALDTNRATIEVMHGIGATDIQVANLFQRRIALDAAAGAISGSAIAALTLLFLAGGSAALAGQLGGIPPFGWRDCILLALLPMAMIALATWVARMAVLSALRKAT